MMKKWSKNENFIEFYDNPYQQDHQREMFYANTPQRSLGWPFYMAQDLRLPMQAESPGICHFDKTMFHHTKQILLCK